MGPLSLTPLYVTLVLLPSVLSAGHHEDGGSYLPKAEVLGENPSKAGGEGKEPRLGFPITFGTDLTGYNTGTAYSPMKIELGGVFLGTLIGLGAVLLAPKLAHIFSPSAHHGSPYSRSETGDDGFINGVTKMMTKIDEALRENNIDTMNCLERAACTYMQSDEGNNRSSLVNFFVDGSKLKIALERGAKGENCSILYPKCLLSKTAMLTGLQSIIVNNTL